MVTLAQRITELRTKQGLTRSALSAALGMGANAAEKFETGRQTPTKEQKQKIADYFGVCLAYLTGESDDPTRQDTWMSRALTGAPMEDAPKEQRKKYKPAGDPESGGVLASLLASRAFHDTLRAEILEVLRTTEGQKLLADIVKKELLKQEK